MPRNRKRSGKADRDARAERARTLRDQIRGLAGKPKPKTPRELTDEAAMEEFRSETKRLSETGERES